MYNVLAPIATPFNNDLSVAHDLYIKHAHWLLNNGCDALLPFGTTGEAASLTINERIIALDKLIESGVKPKQIIVGTGCANYIDTLTLSGHAMQHGCHAVMILPPFYYSNINDAGLYNYYNMLIQHMPDIAIYLYHIPQVIGVGLSLELTKRLADAFPRNIIGLKDSSGDIDGIKARLHHCPQLTIYAGAENALESALPQGLQGCITATANLGATHIQQTYHAIKHNNVDRKALNARMLAIRNTLQHYPIIAAIKAIIAHYSGDPRWYNVRAPLTHLDDSDKNNLITMLANNFLNNPFDVD